MINDTEIKYALSNERANRLDVILSTSDLFKPAGVTDYEKRRAEDVAKINEEIKRISLIIDQTTIF